MICIVTEAGSASVSDAGTCDVQKKLTSWRSLLPEGFSGDISLGRRTVGDLVVVTSLVDRLPNLGGM